MKELKIFAQFAIPHPSTLVYIAMASIILGAVALVAVVTYFKLWGYLWREWITTVDHKKIGIMYLIVALVMLFRGGVDAVMMRLQLAVPDNTFLEAQHYNEVFTTHGVIMILFMAMPFITSLLIQPYNLTNFAPTSACLRTSFLASSGSSVTSAPKLVGPH